MRGRSYSGQTFNLVPADARIDYTRQPNGGECLVTRTESADGFWFVVTISGRVLGVIERFDSREWYAREFASDKIEGAFYRKEEIALLSLCHRFDSRRGALSFFG